jgi:exonuclease VII small subunit
MVFYQRGQDLARYCAALLDQSELKIKQISADQILDFTEG